MVNVESIEPLMFPLDVICEVVVKSPSIRTLEEPVDSAPIAKLPLEPLIKYKLSPPASENIIFWLLLDSTLKSMSVPSSKSLEMI